MHGVVEWLIASLPLVGLVALLSEIVIRDPDALLEIALDSEAFARATPAPPESAETTAPIAGLAYRA
jgi:hypothetical protein